MKNNYICLQDRELIRIKKEKREELVMKWVLIVASAYFIFQGLFAFIKVIL